jgi:hypothetical protein
MVREIFNRLISTKTLLPQRPAASQAINVARIHFDTVFVKRFVASWVMKCTKCGHTMLCAEIEDRSLSDFLNEPKPKFPVDGWEVSCPHCGHRDKYVITDLRYARTANSN